MSFQSLLKKRHEVGERHIHGINPAAQLQYVQAAHAPLDSADVRLLPLQAFCKIYLCQLSCVAQLNQKLSEQQLVLGVEILLHRPSGNG